MCEFGISAQDRSWTEGAPRCLMVKVAGNANLGRLELMGHLQVILTSNKVSEILKIWIGTSVARKSTQNHAPISSLLTAGAPQPITIMAKNSMEYASSQSWRFSCFLFVLQWSSQMIIIFTLFSPPNCEILAMSEAYMPAPDRAAPQL